MCEAVEYLAKEKKLKIQLLVCGRQYYENNVFEKYSHTTYLGMLPNEQFLEKLKNADIFILNSEVESFGLSAVDALSMGCNVLISQNSGVRSVLTLTDADIIFNPHDSSEIAYKIENIISKNNSERILNAIDFERYSWTSVSDRLYKICEKLYKCERYNLIK